MDEQEYRIADWKQAAVRGNRIYVGRHHPAAGKGRGLEMFLVMLILDNARVIRRSGAS